MTVWVTGGGGMLGQAMIHRLAEEGLDHVSSGRDIDIGDAVAIHRFADRAKPSHIINCAAFTAVDDAETNEQEADRVNHRGARSLAELAAERGMSMVQISTDYVFDGSSTAPYAVDAPCAPQSVYGRTKRRGEEAVLATIEERNDGGRVHVLRTSWLFGPGGRNFVATMLRLMIAQSQLQVVADQYGRPTFTHDLAEAIVRLATHATAPSGIYHFANAGETSWHGFALAILEGARQRNLPVVTESIEAVDTAAFPRPAPRPANSVLDTSRLEELGIVPRPWTDALDDYLDELTP